jgi:16S rRNA G966 N2-methylase RsmD
MKQTFAPEFERTEEGWLILPTDAELRKRAFGQVRKHQAKMNLHLLGAIVEYVSEPEERVMDIMAGTGSILIAALAGRKVTMIEISEKYSGWIKEHLDYMESVAPGISSSVMLINAPCQRVLPMPANHIIFSPPYANIMQKKKFSAGDITADLYGVDEDEFSEYAKQPLNVGNRNRFLYNQEMEKIYNLCYESVLPGGSLTVVIKDYIEKAERMYLSTWVQRVCTRAGFLEAVPNKTWFKWKAPGSAFTNIYRSQGKLVVDDEDVLIYVKPEVVEKSTNPAGYVEMFNQGGVRQLVHA